MINFKKIHLLIMAFGIAVAIPVMPLTGLTATNLNASFQKHVKQGKAALKNVITQPNKGQKHVAAGAKVNYGTPFPTSGSHDPVPVAPGFYTTPQAPEKLVHSLEHGNIVIYYDKPDPAKFAILKAWTQKYTGPFDGVILVPKKGLGPKIVLTAWTKLLRLSSLDLDASAAFIDAYRGRGPENPMR